MTSAKIGTPYMRTDVEMFNNLLLPLLGPPRFDMSRLMLATVLALATVRLVYYLKVSFPCNHNPKYCRAVQSLISSPFSQKKGGLNWQRHINSTIFIFGAAKLSLDDSI